MLIASASRHVELSSKDNFKVFNKNNEPDNIWKKMNENKKPDNIWKKMNDDKNLINKWN